MKNLLYTLLLFSSLASAYAIQKDYTITSLPHELCIGQHFQLDGQIYAVKGFSQKESAVLKKITLFLERPLQFGLELGHETVILKIKQGHNKHTDTKYHSTLSNCSRSYNWKAYALAYLVIRTFFPPTITII